MVKPKLNGTGPNPAYTAGSPGPTGPNLSVRSQCGHGCLRRNVKSQLPKEPAVTTSTASIPPIVQSGGHGHGHTTQTVVWGLVVGVINAAVPFVTWWIDPSTMHALIVTLIAAVYVGFAVADGRPRVIAIECTVTVMFVLVAATAVSATPWLIVAAYAAHGLKDMWQVRHQFVSGTRWWPPFCAVIDFVVAAIVTVEIVAGLNFH
jgi:hypothetical protein